MGLVEVLQCHVDWEVARQDRANVGHMRATDRDMNLFGFSTYLRQY